MKTAAAPSRKRLPPFAENYSTALAAYLARPNETALRQA